MIKTILLQWRNKLFAVRKKIPYERRMKITSPSRASSRSRASSPHMNSPLAYKLETFCKEVKHIMIMIIAIICIFFIFSYLFILCDIWSTVENYFQKILRSPRKNPLPLFYSLPPKNSKIGSPLFLATLKIFEPPPAERWGEHCD